MNSEGGKMDLARLVNDMNGRPQPALTYISADERLDLSFHVVANWISKIANLLTLDVGAAPGDVLLLELPRHWRSIVWCAGAWTAGVEVELPLTSDSGATDGDHRDQCQSDSAIGWVGCDEKRALTIAEEGFAGDMWLQVLPSLALRWLGEIPDGVEDGSQAIMSCADALLQPAEESAMPHLSEKLEHIVDAIVSSGSAPVIRGGSIKDVTAVALMAWHRGQAITIVDDSADKQVQQMEQLWIN